MGVWDDLLSQTSSAQSDPNLRMALGLLQEVDGEAKTRRTREQEEHENIHHRL